ncbi:carbohydrate-binding domain-containing protein [Streptomyces sp. NPDC087859]|uniref:carbohydrate-binding domain-containing protein n=1 Tax=Streptomyces sp. NPDC087859 TaxID=3365812 RepID=UPI0038114A3D
MRIRTTSVRTKAMGAVVSAVLGAAALAGCSSSSASEEEAGGSSSSAAASVDGAQQAAAVLAADKEAHDGDFTTSGAEDVALDGKSVTLTEGGTYRLSGKLSDGQVLVNAPGQKVTLILDGVDISSSSGAAIAATEAEELVVVLADGSANTLSDADSYEEDAEANAALFSAGDLTVGGEGALTVHGNGNDGIVSKDGLVIASGTVTVEAADDGVRGKDYLVVQGGSVKVSARGDGLKSDNTEDTKAGYIALSAGTVRVSAAGDGVDAATDLVVTGGTLDVTAKATDDSSAHGLKSGVITVLEKGTVEVDASADGLHSDAAVHLGGAKVTVAAGDDGVHAEGDLVISEGAVEITRSNEGLEGKDITVAGGSTKVTSGDDGVNASGSTTSSEGQEDDQGGGQGGGPGGGGPGGGGGGESVGDFRLKVTGGTLVIDADGDGFDSNGTAEITGGTLVVNGPETGGNGALDVNGGFTVSGGVLLAAGSAGMAVAPDEESGQGWLSATLDSAVAAGTTLHVVDSDGEVVASYVTSKAIQNIVYSSAALKSGSEYRIWSGGRASGEETGGMYTAGDLDGADEIATVTAGDAPEGGFGGGPRR